MQVFSPVCGLRVSVDFCAHLPRSQHCKLFEQTQCICVAGANALLADVAPTQGAHILFRPCIALPTLISYALPCIPVSLEGLTVEFLCQAYLHQPFLG